MKTKEQKRKEAQERARKGYGYEAQRWRDHQVGGDKYKEIMKISGKDAAELRMHEVDRIFRVFLVHAAIDSHGNALTMHELQEAKDKLYGKSQH